MKLITFLLVSCALESRTKQFHRCELVIELVKYGFPLSELRDCKYLFYIHMYSINPIISMSINIQS